MAVPKQKRSKARTRTKHSMNDRKAAPAVSICPDCGSPKAPHRACGTCGYYNAKYGRIIETNFSEAAED